MSQAIVSRLIPVIPGNVNNRDPQLWTRADVLVFLEANKKEFDLDHKDIDTIRTNEVTGLVFLRLTKDELATSYHLPLGAAARIEVLIKGLIRMTKQKQNGLQGRGTINPPPRSKVKLIVQQNGIDSVSSIPRPPSTMPLLNDESSDSELISLLLLYLL